MSELKYRSTCIKIAIAVLANTLMLQVLSTIAVGAVGVFEPILSAISKAWDIDYIDLCYAFEETAALTAYLVSFMIPAFLFMLLSRKEGHEPMRLAVMLTPETPLVIIAAIGTILGSAYINSVMVSFVDFSPLYDTDPIDTPIKILMAFISTAVVPAVCEEFLYRGCVLSNLLPYGKTTAIIGSALLFALMHGNFAQFFYTFIAGLVLGAVYIETGSIWAPTFIHLFNNFYSVIQQVIYDRSGQSEEMNIIIFVLEVIIPMAGLALAGWLIYKRAKRGLKIEAVPTHSVRLERGALVKGFLNPVMIIHIVISVGLASMLLFLAMIMSAGA